MKPFIDFMLAHDIKRFVLLSASSLPKGGPMMGAVHAYLEDVAPEWSVLRPTWFMQNFSEQQHLHTICEESCFYSATGDGKVPFIDVDDIAEVATQALICEQPFNRDMILTGPESLTYDQVAEQITHASGKHVKHHSLTERQLRTRFIESGMDDKYADILTAMDTAIANGSENQLSHEVEKIIGRAPTSFSSFAVSVSDVWRK